MATSATASYELRFDSGRICLDLLATTHPEPGRAGPGPPCRGPSVEQPHARPTPVPRNRTAEAEKAER